eukprot:CAMPEP_0197648202 /NCGR_PEP_ID=MMETSP1338-20131121/27615_1 /TAXON_ID=43686 ORGANISM="Pelagodinium beii, Strain RCC1491" /NCGR_SAMPLE_ID=MMETSP1338 /ASSEMBLY_ACC=CAM_ASM_000754 /LENGTH=582 /DNA_ID=CAMNT_0043222161 /DNA_START=94 /DNA_END=1842 /DNA_ORIENTATION=-
MDAGSATYLEENIGGVLAKALAEMAVVQPKDGVDFLAKWLKSYSEQEEAKIIRDEEEKALADERALTRTKLEEKEKVRQQKLSEQQSLESMYNGILDKFSSSETSFEETFWKELVDVAQSASGASAVYLGVVEQGEEGMDPPGKYISYEVASKGSEWMTEKMLIEGTGVTWGAVTENPPEENFQEMCLWKPPSVEPAPVEPVDGEEPPPEKPANPYYPVKVDCVTDVPAMHYFEMTRLGGYLAIPLMYQSYYTGEAYAEAKTYEEEKKAEAKRRADEEAARLAAIEAGETPEGEAPPEPAEPPEEKPLVMTGKEIKMVLCLDTLGSNTFFSESKVMQVLELVKACGQCKSQTEFKQVDAQVLQVIDEDAKVAVEEQIVNAVTAIDEKMTETIEKEEADCPDEKKDVLQKKFAFLKAVEAAKELTNVIESMKTWVWVTPEVLSVFAAACFIAGFSKEDVYPRRKTVLAWEKLKMIAEKPMELLTKLEKVEFEGPKKGLKPEHKLAFITPMSAPAEMDEEKAKEISPGFMLIFRVIQAALAYRNADLEMRKAEWTKQMAEKEAAGEEYAGPAIPALEELDDDFA